MPRIRSIKPEFWKSEAIAAHTFRARLTFIGLWTYVDDNGVGLDNPKLVAAELFALEDDPRETLANVREDLASLAAAGRITRYTVEGKAYLAITNWREHQKIDRPGKPRYPEPDDPRAVHVTCENVDPAAEFATPSRDSRETFDEPHLPDQGSGNRDQGTGEKTVGADKPRTTKRGTRIPDDFAVTDDMIAWAREHTPHVGARETEAFVDYWRSAPGAKGVKVDWEATWRNWMRRAQENATRPGAALAIRGDRRPSTTDQRVAAGLELAAKYAAEEAS